MMCTWRSGGSIEMKISKFQLDTFRCSSILGFILSSKRPTGSLRSQIFDDRQICVGYMAFG